MHKQKSYAQLKKMHKQNAKLHNYKAKKKHKQKKKNKKQKKKCISKLLCQTNREKKSISKKRKTKNA